MPEIDLVPFTAEINGALENGTPAMVGYVDAEGYAHISPRGSTHVHGTNELAIWVRDPEGGLPRTVGDRPRLTVWYRNPATKTTLQLFGRARIEADPALSQRVYDDSPERERNLDPELRGLALIVAVDRVEGRTPEGAIRMVRAAQA